MQKVFYISQGEWEPHIQHNCKLDDLRAGFEVLEVGTFGHSQTLVRSLPCLKQSSYDKTPAATTRQVSGQKHFSASGKIGWSLSWPVVLAIFQASIRWVLQP